ncbi:MAG: SPOR domain-containing protein [Burkholderiaceae bacterium]|nr:SPOR domain-containing protein [Burkholderiaceae bacterium]
MKPPRRHPDHRPARQQGGTVTGLIVGLIIGLLIAVWVATTIMKTPLPFVDKVGKQSPAAGELGDPNKTLPGGARERRERAPADELRPAAEADDARPPASAPAAQAPATLPAAPAPAALPPAADKPPADKPAAGSTPPASSANVSTPANGEAFTYYLQAGAFRELQDAEATKARLALMGVAAGIAERKSELGTLYRVRVGPFADVDAMNRARVRLSDNGVDAAVVRVPK